MQWYIKNQPYTALCFPFSFALCLGCLCILLNPEKIIIGGGVADAGSILLDPIKATIADRAMPIQAAAVEVVPAQLANTAGVIGASLLINS